MDKINNISFTGIRNIASIQFQRGGCKAAKNLSMTLCDDVHGKDLQEFQDVLKKITGGSFKVENHNQLLNLECLPTEDGRRFFSVNGVVLEEKDENLPMFSYIAKLTRRISAMPEKDMVVNNDYKNIAGRETLISGIEIENYDELLENGFVEQIFNSDWVKDSAVKVNEFIHKMMCAYLGIKK